jgi:hypothetical protein
MIIFVKNIDNTIEEIKSAPLFPHPRSNKIK